MVFGAKEVWEPPALEVGHFSFSRVYLVSVTGTVSHNRCWREEWFCTGGSVCEASPEQWFAVRLSEETENCKYFGDHYSSITITILDIYPSSCLLSKTRRFGD
jgi:hypothetical protein